MRLRIAAAFAAVLLASTANAQTAGKTYRIGLVSTTSPGAASSAFNQELAKLGYVEGGNLTVDARFAKGQLGSVPGLVDAVLRRGVDVLVVSSTAGALAAKKATTAVPVVFVNVVDPVAQGIVASLARPGGNLTGISFAAGGAGFGAKWVELLKEAAPQVSRAAVLWNSANTGSARHVPEIEAAARKVGIRVELFDAGRSGALDRALAAVGASGVHGMIVAGDPFLNDNRGKLVKFAASKRLPAVYFFRSFAEAGGLLSYGSSVEELWRRAAVQADKILKGARPADVPVEQPTRTELVVNLRAAKALGLAIPQSLLIRADEVIE